MSIAAAAIEYVRTRPTAVAIVLLARVQQRNHHLRCHGRPGGVQPGRVGRDPKARSRVFRGDATLSHSDSSAWFSWAELSRRSRSTAPRKGTEPKRLQARASRGASGEGEPAGEAPPPGDAPAAAPPAAATSGDPAAGREVFMTAGCAGCHALSDAGASGAIGPNLDESLPSFELAVDRVTNGAGAMPPFSDQLGATEIEDGRRLRRRGDLRLAPAPSAPTAPTSPVASVKRRGWDSNPRPGDEPEYAISSRAP